VVIVVVFQGDSKMFMRTIAVRWKKMSLAEKERYQREAENYSNKLSTSADHQEVCYLKDVMLIRI